MATTTNLEIELPDVGGDSGTWGNILNTGITALDAIFAADGTAVSINIGTDKTLTATAGAILLPAVANPSQTADGSVVWDSDDNVLTVGTGSGRTTMVDVDQAQTITGTKTFANIATISGDIKSGSYTPTPTAVANVSGLTAQECQFMQVGNVVTISGHITVTATSSGFVNTQWRISLPTLATTTDITHARRLAGMGIHAATEMIEIVGDVTNDAALFTFTPEFSFTNANIPFHFTYRAF